MKWLEAALLALRLAHDFARWVERTQLRSDAERDVLRQYQDEANASIARAEAARARVRADLNADPQRVRDTDDGFRRD